jgi:hypothetical protein
MDQQPTGPAQGEISQKPAAADAAARQTTWVTAAALVTFALMAPLQVIANSKMQAHFEASVEAVTAEKNEWMQHHARAARMPPETVPADSPAEKELETRTRALQQLAAAHTLTASSYKTAATLFTIAGIVAVVAFGSRRKEMWFFSLLAAVAGLLYFNSAFMHAPAAASAVSSEALPPFSPASVPASNARAPETVRP